MKAMTYDHIWNERLDEIRNRCEPEFEINLPEGNLDQDKEYCELQLEGCCRRIRFHDYEEVYRIPGMYERLFCKMLKCNSPAVVIALLEELISESPDRMSDLRVLDLGAGNGMVADELQQRNVDRVVGVDIIDEARQAALRDRPGVYDDYLVVDMTNLKKSDKLRLRSHGFNTLTTVAALGFGDIPPAAFLAGLDLMETPGWIGFNIKEDFIHEMDSTGFCRLVRQLSQEGIIQIQAYRRYQHRLSAQGRPLYYIAMVARKLKDCSAVLM